MKNDGFELVLETNEDEFLKAANIKPASSGTRKDSDELYLPVDTMNLYKGKYRISEGLLVKCGEFHAVAPGIKEVAEMLANLEIIEIKLIDDDMIVVAPQKKINPELDK